MSLSPKSSLLAAAVFAVLAGTQSAAPVADAQDPPPPVPAGEAAAPPKHHVLNSSPVLDKKHSDSAATEARIRKARRYNTPYVYQPYYYYYYIPTTNPGMTTGANMYFPDPGSYAYGFTADGFGYGF